MVCMECRGSNEKDAKYCIHCGVSLRMFQKGKMLLHYRLSHTGGSFHILPFLRVLFDLSFKQFISLKVIRAIYALSILFAGLIAIVIIIAGFYGPLFLGIFMLLIGAPLIFLFIVFHSRVLLEMALFKSQIAQPQTEIREQAELTDGIKWNV